MKLTNENERLFSRAREQIRGLSDGDIVSVWEYDLDRTAPQGFSDGFVVVTEASLSVFENGEQVMEVPLSSVQEIFARGKGMSQMRPRLPQRLGNVSYLHRQKEDRLSALGGDEAL